MTVPSLCPPVGLPRRLVSAVAQASLVCAALGAASAQASNVPVATPTSSPFTPVVQVFDHPGVFSDNYFFDVQSTHGVPSSVWTFPFNPTGDLAALFETSSVFLQLFNQDTNTLVGYGLTPPALGLDLFADPVLGTYFSLLRDQGFDANQSLFWQGVLPQGHYRANITGWAGGAQSGRYGGGGLTLTEFRVPDVPEPALGWLLAVGLTVVGGLRWQGKRLPATREVAAVAA